MSGVQAPRRSRVRFQQIIKELDDKHFVKSRMPIHEPVLALYNMYDIHIVHIFGIYIYIRVNIYKSNGILMPGLVGSDLSEFAVAEAGKWRHQQSSESSESSA